MDSSLVSESTIIAGNETEMLALGAEISRACPAGLVIYLAGDLGMGKTTLSRGFLQCCGHRGPVKSPTYTLVEPYQFGLEYNNRQVFHFDLYRLGDPGELEYMGIRDYFNDIDICLIEWPDKGEGFLPPADLVVRIEPHKEGRKLSLQGNSKNGKKIIKEITPLVVE